MRVTILISLAVYFILLTITSMIISRHNEKKNENDAFFGGERKSPWLLVAIGMIGTSVSGVTFISVPGTVASQSFLYMQIVIGNILGYLFIAKFLIPFFYKMKSISIYAFLKDRLGKVTEKTTSIFFLISKLLGAGFRFYLVIAILATALSFDSKIGLIVIAIVTLLITYLYTKKSGLKTIVITDFIQSCLMIIAMIVTVVVLLDKMDISLVEVLKLIINDPNTKMFELRAADPKFFVKDILSGFVLGIAMSGLDQDQMQKNLTCENYSKSQKNIVITSICTFFTVLIFLVIGYMLYMFAAKYGVTETKDALYPAVAYGYLGIIMPIAFTIGICSACFSSVDSALTAMTSSTMINIFGVDTKNMTKKENTLKKIVHFGFMVALVIMTICFSNQDESIINLVVKVAGYTYGPIIGIFAYACLLKRKTNDKLVPLAAIISVLFTAVLDIFSPSLINYTFGFELSVINGLTTFLLMLLFSIGNNKKIDVK